MAANVILIHLGQVKVTDMTVPGTESGLSCRRLHVVELATAQVVAGPMTIQVSEVTSYRPYAVSPEHVRMTSPLLARRRQSSAGKKI